MGMSEACACCGFLVPKDATCFVCTTAADFSDGVSDTHSSQTCEMVFLNREAFTNCCANLLRHIGTTDFTKALEFFLAAIVDMSVQPEWQQFWDRCPPCDGWTCEVCHAKSDSYSAECCICGQFRIHLQSRSSDSDDEDATLFCG